MLAPALGGIAQSFGTVMGSVVVVAAAEAVAMSAVAAGRANALPAAGGHAAVEAECAGAVAHRDAAAAVVAESESDADAVAVAAGGGYGNGEEHAVRRAGAALLACKASDDAVEDDERRDKGWDDTTDGVRAGVGARHSGRLHRLRRRTPAGIRKHRGHQGNRITRLTDWALHNNEATTRNGQENQFNHTLHQSKH